MIYIGIVIAVMLVSASLWHTKKRERAEADFINGLKGASFKLKTTLKPAIELSGMGNSVLFAGRLWGVYVTDTIEAGQNVRIDSVHTGALTIKQASVCHVQIEQAA